MKSIKYTVVSLLIIFFCFHLAGEERKKPIPMKELTDPRSPSYVPYPYPRKRAEIIADFKYYCEKCDFGTYAEILFTRHCETKKHN